MELLVYDHPNGKFQRTYKKKRFSIKKSQTGLDENPTKYQVPDPGPDEARYGPHPKTKKSTKRKYIKVKKKKKHNT